jgi:hypothetical protein
MNNFEFDDIIRRKFEGAKFGDAEASFSKIKGKLNRRRYYFYFSRSLPYAGVLLLGIGIGYFMNDLKYTTVKTASEQKQSPIKEPLLASEPNTNSSQWNHPSVINNPNSEIHSPKAQASGTKQKSQVRNTNSFNTVYNYRSRTATETQISTFNNANNNIDIKNFSLTENLELAYNSNSSSNENIGSSMNEKNNIKNDTVQFKNKLSVVTDSAVSLNNPPISYLKENKNKFYFHAFGGYSFGWQNAGVVNARGLIPEIGIIYERTLPENLFFRTGLNMTMIRDLKNCVNTFTLVEADTRYRQTIWEFKTPVVYYLRIPLMFGWKSSSGKNFLHLGFLVNFLMNSKNEINKYSYTAGQHFKIESMTDYGYAMEGFNRWNTEFTIGFRRRINKNLRLGVDFAHHITNVIRNYSFFDNQQNKTSKAPTVYAGIEYKF